MNEVDICMKEYSEMRAELRMLFGLINENIKSACTLFIILGSVGAYLKDIRLIYAIPTIMFMFMLIGIWQMRGLNLLGAYCAKIACKVRLQTDPKKVAMDWELNDPFGSMSRSPTGMISMGIMLSAVPLLITFLVLAILAALNWHWWTAVIHFLELLVLVYFFYKSLQLNHPKYRLQIINESPTQNK
ncbi:MAG TPA: hypothetical protein VHC95_12415 [Opitutales bacterium]|nr:hypothetical protein [Opitutales bacterium]